MPTIESITEDVRKQLDPTPFYAALGVTDLAVEMVRERGEMVREANVKARADLAPKAVQARAHVAVEQVRKLPATALNEAFVVAGKVAEGYEDLAMRGKDLATRIRGQQATKDLVAQADATVAMGKGAMTTARKAAADVERSAKATFTTGRKEAIRAGEAIATSITEEARFAAGEMTKEARLAAAEVTTSAKRTRTAARRTTTTAKNATKRTTSRTKAATTSARKTATASRKATKKAAEKVGD